MNPIAPAANPTSLNSNQPFGGYGQALTDQATAGNILNYLPQQEQQTTTNATNANTNPGSILPNVSINAPTYTSPTAPVINAGNYGNNLTGYNTAVQHAEQGLTSAENNTFGQALGTLQSAEQQYGNLTPIYQSLANQYNIPGYQSDIATLSGLLGNLSKDVNAQTTLGGGAITQSARDEMYSNEAQPLNTALNQAGEFLNYGQQDVSNLLDTYQKSLSNALTPLEQNISSLPTLFGQTNEAAQAGYSQGATTLEDVIQNAERQQEIQAEQEQASAAMRQANVLAGSGGNAAQSLLGSTNGQTGNKASYGLKVANNPGSGYYFEDATGKPISAVQYAQTTGMPPLQVITAMANSGDNGAKQLLDQLNTIKQTSPNVDLNNYITQYYGSF